MAKQLSGDEFRLYELIWKRTVASQMGDAKGSTATIRLGAVATDGRDAEFSASGTVITFPGFLAAYEEGKDESRGDDDSDEARRLPNVAKDDALTASDILAVGHETSPPPRFTEASLTAELEKKASAVRQPMPPPFPLSRTAATSGSRVPHWCPAGSPSR
ncbi:DNA topoisomerase 1 [Arthrobacter sp. Hiyo4]|nr:DNA topoisomerase 1 [Arthrobacter sp. Hiyo4]